MLQLLQEKEKKNYCLCFFTWESEESFGIDATLIEA